uniref:Flap endonuclease GEN-like 1 n=1 Tax=Physcomitrium patens TaxID=3218 RepID=A0A7I4ACV3_PHYPA
MGVRGGFWDELRVVSKRKSLDWLHGKRLAVDLSYWVVQQQTAVGGLVRKPHLRILLFRVVNLISRAGVLPVFVVDGTFPPEKLAVRMERLTLMSTSNILPNPQEFVTGESNIACNNGFQRRIDECVELLELLGMPVLHAAWEAEGLCAELDRDGLVDACVTADSDAFLHGARCVIKVLQMDSKVPIIETYDAEDIKTILGLDREHMIALALLMGCDYNKKGVVGIGCNRAIRLVRSVSSNKVFDRLKEWGGGEHTPDCLLDFEDDNSEANGDQNDEGKSSCRKPDSVNTSMSTKKSLRHCGNCGHLGTRREHIVAGCTFCKGVADRTEATEWGCLQKEKGFQCACEACVKQDHDLSGSLMQKKKSKKSTRQKNWWVKCCDKMAKSDGFPNEDIINIFLRPGCSNFAGEGSPSSLIKWRIPKMELLEDFLHINLHWDTSFVRQRMLPLLSTICLKGLAARNQSEAKMWNDYPFENTILGRFIPHSIKRIKVEKSREFYLLQWTSLASSTGCNWLGNQTKNSSQEQTSVSLGNLTDLLPDTDCDINQTVDVDTIPIEAEQGNDEVVFATVEDINLVEAACPELVEAFEQEQAAKEVAKATRKRTKRKESEQESSSSQQSIKDFFKVRKGSIITTPRSKSSSDGSVSSEHFPKHPLPTDGLASPAQIRLPDTNVNGLRRNLFF